MFLVCGEAVIDLFQDSASQDNAAESLSFKGQAAGSPFNVAVGLSRLGCKATFMTGLSRDPFGERLIEALSKEGVDWHLAQRTNRPTILSFVLINSEGIPEYAFYGENGADADVRLSALPIDLPPEIVALHIGGFPMAVEPAKTAYAALLKRETARLFVSLDPNIRIKLVGPMDMCRDHFESLCSTASLIKASTEDIGYLYKGVDAVTIAKRWRTLGAGTVVITDGPKGAFALNNHGTVLSKTETVKVLDTVGAGDSFMSALLASIQNNQLLNRNALAQAPSLQIKSILDFANRAAAITCTRRGSNPPTLAEMKG
jgi:fructokinase